MIKFQTIIIIIFIHWSLFNYFYSKCLHELFNFLFLGLKFKLSINY